MTFEKKHGLGVAAMLATAILWSSSGAFIKYIQWNPMAIASVRSFIALFLLVPLCKNLSWRFSGKQWILGLGYMAMMLSFVVANKWTTAANAILLQYTSPVFIILLGTFFLGEKAGFRDVVTLVVTALGMSLFFLDDLGGGVLGGDLLSIFSGFAVAIVAVVMRKMKDGRVEGIVLGNILVVLAGLPFIEAPFPDTYGWISLVYLGIIQLGLSFFLYTWCVPHISTLEQALLPMIEPLLNPLWVVIFIGEKPGLISLVGGAVVLLSVVGRCLWDYYYPARKAV
ncbi:MAG: DMT family transporter [Negativicutes bacterium]|jgi:drug/metabolite transporter (DMT)-like permease|nr:DMT family transporter [Negativicutes bacterium]